MPLPRFDGAELESFFAKDVDTDNYYGIQMIPHEHPPAEALAMTIELARLAPDDDRLCWVGVAVLEPVLELHWNSLGESVDAALVESRELRKALSCVWLSGVPSVVEQRWRSLVPSEDAIGRS